MTQDLAAIQAEFTLAETTLSLDTAAMVEAIAALRERERELEERVADAEREREHWRQRSDEHQYDAVHERQRAERAEGVLNDVREWWNRESDGPQYNGHARDSEEGQRIWSEWFYGNMDLCAKVRDTLNTRASAPTTEETT